MPPEPVPTRRDTIIEVLHGKAVADPYRWLEDGTSLEVSQWVDAQNALKERVLSQVPERQVLHARLTQLVQIGSISLPAVRRTRAGALRLFFLRRQGAENQPVLYFRDGLRGSDRVLVNPNLEAADGTTSLDWYEPSRDGSLLAFGSSRDGTEDSTLRVRDVQAGSDLPDVIERTRHASIAWTADSKGFFYSRYPAPGSVPRAEERYHRRIYQHRLGSLPEADPLAFGAELAPTDFPGCQLSPNDRWLLVNVGRGWNESALHLADLKQPGLQFQRVSPDTRARYEAVLRDDALYVLTNEGAARYRIFEVDARRPQREAWKLIVPEHAEDVIDNFDVIGDHLIVGFLHAGASRLERFDRNGKSRGQLDLPELGTNDGVSGLPDGTQAFYAFESFVIAPQIRSVDLTSGREELWEAVTAPVQPADYLVSEHTALSRDGTAIPYRVVRRRDHENGPQPTLLYGYGGFNQNMQPRFSRSNFAWLERGGVYVLATLRGGGEFGESWHRAGQLEKKQNTFDDFFAVARDLIARGITDSRRLGIYGRSNGGLLVAAAVTQHPELFRAAVAGVPLSDMLRYPRFLIAKLWIPEYGSPDDPREFEALFAYSPYHRVVVGTRYPALLATTAEGDTRVDPLHARKFVAALQHASISQYPVLLRTERQAGHGAGLPISKLVEELTDLYSFLCAELGVSEGGPLQRAASEETR